MRTPPIVVSLGTTIQDVATLLTDEQINAVPVVDDQERLIGIVSRADIIRLMAEEDLESDASANPAG
jgi:CBS domain-containing protein